MKLEKQYESDVAPYYLPLGNEVALFLAAYEERLPVLLKGPTGCGKTRFVEHMAHVLYRGDLSTIDRRNIDNPMYTVACHEDLSATDLVGRYLLSGNETIWQDGPLTQAVKGGSICYLDEIVEARKDSTVLIHSLTDHRRILSIEKKGEILEANENFLLVISYNPGYQNVLKDLKPSTRQRFVAIDFDYPNEEKETEILVHESGLDLPLAKELALLGARIRNLRHHGFDEGVSTRLLVYTAQLIGRGVNPIDACGAGICRAVTDDHEVQDSIAELVSTVFPES
ncbi:MAG: CbbQ/NirQ/NorQ/GpvN family protein [Candidatus Azotimanducaceae bacterium]|uniref:CbbQ/NirQ/NorQ/GpvN family protein n=1 Tax=OM182 bacterium TaxID=2510334 RepID=A0A520S0B0_9GAMM|nr:AAA family ATPase [Gammaproteobacteria bacterium]RZO75864.1 MAG: CbbQ/NirQ/NorQ/GpvN family protein [OM182 bacterium]